MTAVQIQSKPEAITLVARNGDAVTGMPTAKQVRDYIDRGRGTDVYRIAAARVEAGDTIAYPARAVLDLHD